MAEMLDFRMRETGMYEVYLVGAGPSVRLGLVSGARGSWHAEASDGTALTPLRNCKTRKEAGDRLHIHYRQKRDGEPNRRCWYL